MPMRDTHPDSGSENLRKCLEEEFEKAVNQKHSAVMKRCDVVYLPPQTSGYGRYIVNVLNKTYTVELDQRKVVELVTGRDADEKLAYVIVHYLTSGGMAGGQESWVSTETILNTQPLKYYYQRNVLRPLERMFGYERQLFEEVSTALGGKKEKLGGTAYHFTFLPRVRLLLQLWPGKTEEMIKPKVGTSFNSSARNFLKETPLIYALESLVWFMEKEVRKRRRQT